MRQQSPSSNDYLRGRNTTRRARARLVGTAKKRGSSPSLKEIGRAKRLFPHPSKACRRSPKRGKPIDLMSFQFLHAEAGKRCFFLLAPRADLCFFLLLPALVDASNDGYFVPGNWSGRGDGAAILRFVASNQSQQIATDLKQSRRLGAYPRGVKHAARAVADPLRGVSNG